MSTEPNPLSNLLFGQIRGGVLALLYGRPDESFYVRQIARTLGASAGAVQREMEKLAHVGLVMRKRVGNQVFYQVNRHSSVFAEMHSLVNKTAGVFGILRSRLKQLSEGIVVAFVYGSFARQEESTQSDIDVMIIGDIKLDQVLLCLEDVTTALGRTVNPTVYSPKEFKLKLAAGNHFVNAVIRAKKVFLIGSEDELRKVAGVRLAKAGRQQSI